MAQPKLASRGPKSQTRRRQGALKRAEHRLAHLPPVTPGGDSTKGARTRIAHEIGRLQKKLGLA